jgi:hypothetical protein
MYNKLEGNVKGKCGFSIWTAQRVRDKQNQEGLPQRHRVYREEILNPKLEIPDNIKNPKFKHLYFDIVQNLEIRAWDFRILRVLSASVAGLPLLDFLHALE